MKTDRLRTACLEDPSLTASLRAWLEEQTALIQKGYHSAADMIEHRGKEKQMRHLDTALTSLLKPRRNG